MIHFNEFTDDELAAEVERLINLYPSVEYPFINDEVKEDMHRLEAAQIALYVRRGAMGIHMPYTPLYVMRIVNPDDIKFLGEY